MKRMYEKPTAEKVEFNYREQVVASGGTICQYVHVNEGMGKCESGGYWTPNYQVG